MESWVLLSIGASLIWALVNFLDRIVLSDLNIDPLDFLIVGSAVGIMPVVIAGLLGYFSLDLETVPFRYYLFSFFSGFGISLFNLLYFNALKRSSVQLVSILTRVEPLFTTMWGYYFLKEEFSVATYGGGIMLIAGAAISILSHTADDQKGAGNSKNRIVWGAATLMLLGAFIGSISTFLQAIALSQITLITAYSIQRLGVFTPALILFFVRGIKINNSRVKKSIAFMSIIECLSLVGFLFLSIGLANGPLTLVGFLASLQPVWVSILFLAMTLYFPQSKKYSSFKIYKVGVFFSTVFVILGLFLMNRQ